MELRPLKPSTARRDQIEEQMSRRRDRERQHADEWSQRVRYYDRMQCQANKFDQLTSPRYYASHSARLAETRAAEEKRERLEKRREALRQLYQEEDASYGIQLTVHRARQSQLGKHKQHASQSVKDDVPLELLQKVTASVKHDADDRRRRAAENALYRHWADNSAVLRECRSNKMAGDVKLSWLDQQIEKRMKEERMRDETRKFLEQQEALMRDEKRRDAELAQEAERKQEEYRSMLEEQMALVVRREAESREMQKREAEEAEMEVKLAQLESEWEAQRRRRISNEVALENMKQARRKLQLKAQTIGERIDEERAFFAKLEAADLVQKVRDAEKKREIQEGFEQFQKMLLELKELEMKRKQHLQFTFESEAASVFHSFDKAWRQEEQMRQQLMESFLQGLRQQIEQNVANDRQKRLDLLKERENMLKSIEEQREIQRQAKEDEEKRKEACRKSLEAQMHEKKVRQKQLKELEKRSLSEELENMRLEEDKLREEIVKIQNSDTKAQSYGRKRRPFC